MAWLRIEDTAHSHPLVLALAVNGDVSLGNEALGWVVRCASWSAEHLMDGWINEGMAVQLAGGLKRYRLLLKICRAAGILAKRSTRGPAGPGPMLVQDEDAVMHLRTREEVTIDRERRGTTRQQDAVMAVRLRDGDQCRYCQRTVNFYSRKGARRGSYDHPDPDDRVTFVVACGECNGIKGKRTAEQWHTAGGPALQDPPHDPYRTDKTTAWLTQAGLLPPAARTPASADPAAAPSASAALAPTGTQPDEAAPSSPTQVSQEAVGDHADGSGSGPDPSACALPGQAPPGRDGSRIGSGASPGPNPRTRDGPARRGSRGGRSRTRTAGPRAP